MAKQIIVLQLFALFLLFCHCTFTSVELPLIEEIPTYCKRGGESNLYVDSAGNTYLSWIEYVNDSLDVLAFSKLIRDHWSSPITIASGNDWFVNWADFPSITVFKNKDKLAAHWLQKSNSGTYDYDVRIAFSKDGGENWSGSLIPHRDSIPAEHGFVSMMPLKNDRILATWLDGRNTKSGHSIESDDHGHGHGGNMTLRAAEIDIEGNLFNEVELDHKVCDCCQTDAAMTEKGPIIVYRDRKDQEIRDISIVRKIGKDWTQPRTISNDHWNISGCPVNGPAIDAKGENVAIGWFTVADNLPKVKIAFSKDSGATFSEPLVISEASPLGRVDVILKGKKTYLSWLEKKGEGADIMLATIDSNSGKLLEKKKLLDSSPSRKSGFPILEQLNDQLILSWTHVDPDSTYIRTAFINP